MARAKEHTNGRLDEAIATLAQAQAIMVQTQAALVAQKAESDQRVATIEKEKFELDKRFTDSQLKIEKRFAQIEAILLEHNRILQSLANTVGEKIGFKAPAASKAEE